MVKDCSACVPTTVWRLEVAFSCTRRYIKARGIHVNHTDNNCISRRWRAALQDFRADLVPVIASDDYLVAAKLRTKLSKDNAPRRKLKQSMLPNWTTRGCIQVCCPGVDPWCRKKHRIILTKVSQSRQLKKISRSYERIKEGELDLVHYLEATNERTQINQQQFQAKLSAAVAKNPGTKQSTK